MISAIASLRQIDNRLHNDEQSIHHGHVNFFLLFKCLTTSFYWFEDHAPDRTVCMIDDALHTIPLPIHTIKLVFVRFCVMMSRLVAGFILWKKLLLLQSTNRSILSCKWAARFKANREQIAIAWTGHSRFLYFMNWKATDATFNVHTPRISPR